MAKPEILQMGSYPEWDQAPLDAAYSVHRLFEAADPAAFLAKVGAGLTGIVTRGDLGASTTVLDACPNVKIVAVYGVGYDAVDMATCRARGIRVTNTPDVLTDDVADLAVGMMLAQGRRMRAAEAFARDGSWAKGGFPLTHRVSGAKAGILGLGRIGTAIARRLTGFGMDIAYSSRAPKDVPVDWTYIADPVALAQHSDYLFVALAATPETRHIVGRDVIAALGAQGMVINISRAANIDETALLEALESGALGGAGLDVFEGEPAFNPRFLALENVLIQPHHGSGTVETRKDMGQLMRNNLAAFFAGQPLPTAVI